MIHFSGRTKPFAALEDSGENSPTPHPQVYLSMADTAFSREFLELQEAVSGRYTLERELGRGGMGVVFLARDSALDRPVALKLLPPYLAAQPELRERFVQEARVVARLSHPNIVTVYAAEQLGDLVRSEERRVGKECRCRRPTDDQ